MEKHTQNNVADKVLGSRAAPANYSEALGTLLKHFQTNPNGGRFARDLVDQLSSFDKRADEVLEKYKIEATLPRALFKLAVHDLAVNDMKVASVLEISIEAARKVMKTLHEKLPRMFSLQPDDRYGWYMIVKEEGMELGIK